MDDDHEKTAVPRSSGVGKLLIKMKINSIKFEQGGAANEDRIWPQRNDEPRVCNVCNKGFSSGKALGGHMRVHVQANKEWLLLKKLKTNSTSTSKGSSGGCADKPTCSLCGKNFPAMKSLFGHMRCHPEREWRGIHQPSAAKNSPISSSVSDPEPEQIRNQTEDSVIDLTESLQSWCLKDKRGRKALVTEEQKLFDAVNDLMRLACGDSLESGLSNKNIVDAYDFDATNRNSLINIVQSESKKRRIEQKECRYPVKKLRIDERVATDVKILETLGRGKVHVLKQEYIPGSVDELDGKKSQGSNRILADEDQLIASYKYSKSSNTKKKSKKKLRDLESVRACNKIPVDQVHIAVEIMAEPPPDKYKCSTCNKRFPTHQALGGHRSSHNKVRINSHHIDESSIAADKDDELETKPMSLAEVNKEDEGAGSSKLATESNHQCRICSKSFSTGQDLVGHSRSHLTGSTDQADVSSQAASPGEASRTGGKILEFDLNELPAMEDEEDGYAYYESNSSRINSVP